MSGSQNRSAAEDDLRAQLVEAGRRLAGLGLVAGSEGNLSARLPDGRLLVTPTGLRKGDLRPGDLLIVEARETEAAVAEGPRPTSELGMHRALYERGAAGAVVHAHPPYATAFAAAGRPLEPPLLAEQVVLLGTVPLLPFAVPGTPAVGEAVRGLPEGCRAFLLAHHGATAVGASPDQALLRMELLESVARITWRALQLDPQSALDLDDLRALREEGP